MVRKKHRSHRAREVCYQSHYNVPYGVFAAEIWSNVFYDGKGHAATDCGYFHPFPPLRDTFKLVCSAGTKEFAFAMLNNTLNYEKVAEKRLVNILKNI